MASASNEKPLGPSPSLPPRVSVDLTGDKSSDLAGDASPPTGTADASGAAAGGQRKSLVPANIADSASAALASFSKGFAKVRQLTNEALGNAEKTEPTEEYRLTELQFDRIKSLYENLIKLLTLYVHPGPMTGLKLQVAEAVSQVTDVVTSDTSVVERLRAVNLESQSADQVLGNNFLREGSQLGENSPLATALMKCGENLEKIGKAKLTMNLDIYDKFVKAIQRILDGPVRVGQSTRKTAQSKRLELDAIKLRLKNAKPEAAAALDEQLTQAQVAYDVATQDALQAMRGVIQSPEPLAAVADFMTAMLAYFQTGYELLAEIVPEIDAMKVAEEAAAAATLNAMAPK